MTWNEAFSLKGETALITGGATGIGLGIAEALVASGAKVILASRNEAALKEAAGRLGERADYRVFDVTQFDTCPALIDSIRRQHGPVTTLVNNAGNHLKKPAEDVTEEEMLGVLNVHVLGASALSRCVAGDMLAAGTGHILFIASMTSYLGQPQVSAYTAAKSACLGLVRAFTADWAPRGIRVNAIAPGWIDTAILHRAIDGDPERKAKILGRTPMARFGQIEDIGWAAAYLCSPAAKFITGVCLPVDGGALIGF